MQFDVIVVGGGNAALCAALAAREEGANVAIVDASTKEERGGNSRFATSAFRIPHKGVEDLVPLLSDESKAKVSTVTCGPYTPEDYRAAFKKTSCGWVEADQLDVLLAEAYDAALWMKSKGVNWELHVGKHFSSDVTAGSKLALSPGAALRAKGEGVGLMHALWEAVEAAGITAFFDHPGHDLIVEGDLVRGIRVRQPDGFVDFLGQVVMCSGGFSASPMMRRRYLGEGWDLVRIRGTRFNTGFMLERALAAGAQAYGHFGGCHASQVDMYAPPAGQPENQAARYSFSYSIMVNMNGERFVDEGEDTWEYIYAKLGDEVRRQPGSIAFQIFDQKGIRLLETRYRYARPIHGATIEELAKGMGIDPSTLRRTVDTYNAACVDGAFDPFHNDGLSTQGLSPAKSNWALRIDQGPFVAYGVTCAITFTYGGIRTDLEGRVLNNEHRVMPGLFAAGETVGGLFYFNYPGGSGLPRGAVFGRRAGRNAARAARSTPNVAPLVT